MIIKCFGLIIQNIRLITINKQNYFYDIEFKDAYKYDKVSGLVIPQGFIFNIK